MTSAQGQIPRMPLVHEIEGSLHGGLRREGRCSKTELANRLRLAME